MQRCYLWLGFAPRADTLEGWGYTYPKGECKEKGSILMGDRAKEKQHTSAILPDPSLGNSGFPRPNS